MFYNVLKAKKLVNNDENKIEKKILLQDKESCFDIIALEKNEIIGEHSSAVDTAVYVLDGKIEIHFEAEKYVLEKGELLMFKKDHQHKVLALKDSKFFLIKV